MRSGTALEHYFPSPMVARHLYATAESVTRNQVSAIKGIMLLIMSRLLSDNYIIIEKGRTKNQAFRVLHLECRKTGKQLFACSRLHAGKTLLSMQKNTGDQIFYPINNVNNFNDAILAVESYTKTIPKIWSHEEQDEAIHKSNRATFEVIDQYIDDKLEIPVEILDIGAGYAWVDGLLQEKYDSSLYLLDGDSLKNQSAQERDGGYGESSSFQFYREKFDLIRSYDERGLRYNFIDAQNIQMPPISFDLILSLTSCGFHYPLSTYSELMKNHSKDQTAVIIDLRASSARRQLRETGFELVSILKQDDSSLLAHIQPSAA